MKRAGRADARQMWSQVADGELDDPDTRAWLQGVAAAILRADDDPDPTGKERPGRVLVAAGLAGRKQDTGRNYAAMRALEVLKNAPAFETMVRCLAAQSTGDLRWLGKHRTVRDAHLVAIAELLDMPHELAETPAGRDKIAARVRVARREP